ncbi:MAG: tripartite tricarboxylate transporter substrate binding protein [Betaproteobacteria bacterium]|nr:tripartite tricarboxylate transporter substrate binding protein [Betaproteobacteria bacterium]
MKPIIRCFVALLALGAIAPALAQRAYPEKPIKLVVGFPPGSAADVIARIVAPKLGDGLGQPVLVENKPGAGSNIAAEAVVRAPADGYTLLLGSSANTINASLFKMGFDFSTDLAPIALIAEAPGIVVAHPSAPGTVRELIAAAKARPGEIFYASSGSGTIAHLWGELFNLMTGIKLAHIPYKGSAPAAVDLLAGRVSLQFTPASTVVPHVKSGKLKALASIGQRRLAALPELSTLAESGIRGFEASLWFGLNAPAATPRTIIERLNRATVRLLALPEVKTQFAAQSIEALPGTSEQFGALIKQDSDKWANVIKTAKVKID